MPGPSHRFARMAYRLIQLNVAAMKALVAGDLAMASETLGEPLTQFLVDVNWLWRIRINQVRQQPEDLEWIARPAVAIEGSDSGLLVGHIGFHGSPDTSGMVEVAYCIDPVYRRRGHARALLSQVIVQLEADDRVRVVRASISPDNDASLGTIDGLGFEQNGEQWDEEDGLELIYERPV